MINARKYLESFRTDESRIELKLKQMQNLQDRLCSISTFTVNEQVSHTRNVSVMADTMATIIDMQKEIDQQTSEIVRRKQEAYLLLDQIKPENAAILIDYYFEKKTIDAIGHAIHVEKRQTYRKLSEAIAELQTILNNRCLSQICDEYHSQNPSNIPGVTRLVGI